MWNISLFLPHKIRDKRFHWKHFLLLLFIAFLLIHTHSEGQQDMLPLQIHSLIQSINYKRCVWGCQWWGPNVLIMVEISDSLWQPFLLYTSFQFFLLEVSLLYFIAHMHTDSSGLQDTLKLSTHIACLVLLFSVCVFPLYRAIEPFDLFLLSSPQQERENERPWTVGGREGCAEWTFWWWSKHTFGATLTLILLLLLYRMISVCACICVWKRGRESKQDGTNTGRFWFRLVWWLWKWKQFKLLGLFGLQGRNVLSLQPLWTGCRDNAVCATFGVRPDG